MYIDIGMILNVPNIFIINGTLIPRTINNDCLDIIPDDFIVDFSKKNTPRAKSPYEYKV